MGDYHHPETSIHLVYGGNDQTGALNQGLLYYARLAATSTPSSGRLFSTMPDLKFLFREQT